MATVKAHKLGPGSLKLGDTGEEVEFAIALREAKIVPDLDEGDTLAVLSGDEFDEGDEETYALEGKVLQSYDVDSFLVWAHEFAGQVVPFKFTPDNDKALAVKGSVKVRRVQIGGDVKTRNESDFSFPGRNGMYELVDATSDAALAFVAAATVPPVEDATPEWD